MWGGLATNVPPPRRRRPQLLPCRYPFLLVDRVVEIEYGKSAVGYKNITVNDQFFNGHFPERAIMPGEGHDSDVSHAVFALISSLN